MKAKSMSLKFTLIAKTDQKIISIINTFLFYIPECFRILSHSCEQMSILSSCVYTYSNWEYSTLYMYMNKICIGPFIAFVSFWQTSSQTQQYVYSISRVCARNSMAYKSSYTQLLWFYDTILMRVREENKLLYSPI